MASDSEKTGLLLCNLGTPDSTSIADVRRYLSEFLMDPYVIDIPFVPRWLLVQGLILRTRPKKSSEAYKKVWMAQGSPLLAISLEQKQKLQELMGDKWVVELGMRYGNPSLRAALEKFKSQGIKKIVYLPLYPQYALSSTKTAQVELHKQIKQLGLQIELKDLSDQPFHSHPAFVEAYARTIKKHVDLKNLDHLLFSYHGLPERHIKKTESVQGH